jgi:hypothetical protein
MKEMEILLNRKGRGTRVLNTISDDLLNDAIDGGLPDDRIKEAWNIFLIANIKIDPATCVAEREKFLKEILKDQIP